MRDAMKCLCGKGTFIFHVYDDKGNSLGLRCPECKPPKNNIMLSPIDKGERARPGSSKPSMAKYENDIRQGCYALMFLEDVRDQRLITELIRQGCTTNVTAPNNPAVYDGILQIWDNFKFDERTVRSSAQESNIVFSLKSILFGTYGYSHHVCGADIEIVEELCDMTRSLDEDYNLRTQVIFIGNQNEGDRHEAFRNAYELGDVAININAIKEDPMEILKLLPARYPNEDALNRIISDAAI